MKSLRLYGPNDIRLDEVPLPSITEDELLLKTDAAAICGTDVRMWQNGYKGVNADHPLVLGHEFAATVVQVGANVPFYQKGMQVAMAPNIGCGICNKCVRGDFHLCNDYRAFGINMDGAFAEYIRVPKEALTHGNLMILPKGVSPEEAAVNEPLSCVYNGFLKCDVRPGDHVLIVGSGPIGIMHAQLAKMAGAAKVMMNDLSEERLAESAAIVKGMLTYRGDDLPGFVFGQTGGRGLDVAVVACPSPEVQAAMLPLMEYGGRVIFFGGVPAGKQPVAIDTNIIHYKELFITGSTRANICHFRKTLEFIASGLVDVKSLVTARFKIENILTAFDFARQAKGLKNVILF